MQPQKPPHIFFQKQSYFSAECGVCALNNFIGDQIFFTQTLTQICRQLSKDLINPYKGVFGGDYDVTVLILALENFKFQVRWLKKDQNLVDVFSAITFKGLLINTPQKSIGAHLLKLIKQSGRHWTCLKKIGNYSYLLDSLQNQPLLLNNQQETLKILEEAKKLGGTILVVQLPQIGESDRYADESS